MTPRTLFTIILKIFGIYLIYTSILVIPDGVTTILTFKQMAEDGNSWIAYGIILTILVLLVYYALIHFCIYKTDWVITKLALAEHFEEERFEINIHRSTVLRIAVIAIGALIFIDAVPIFCRQVFIYFKQVHTEPLFNITTNGGWSIYYFVQMFIGYFMMSSSRLIVNFIERNRKKNSLEQEEEKNLS